MPQRFATTCRATARVLVLALTGFSVPANAAGTPGDGGEPIPEGQTSAGAAAALYQEGIEHKETALGLEAAAAAAEDEAERQRLLEEARAEFRAAVQLQGRALKLDLDFYQAANELGYALRKNGDFTKALGAYNFALQIKPDFYAAIEYRGEAYLALGRLDEAKGAYLTLFRNDPALAARLLAAMSAGATEDAAFRAWVEERARLAVVTPGAAGADADW
ncbi:MAG TPA: tetratricopeptide repeat protein [Pseudomonadales bacterium]